MATAKPVKSSTPKINLDAVNVMRANKGQSAVNSVQSTTGQKYATSAAGSAYTNMGVFGNQPKIDLDVANTMRSNQGNAPVSAVTNTQGQAYQTAKGSDAMTNMGVYGNVPTPSPSPVTTPTQPREAAPTTATFDGYIPNGYERLANGSLHLIDQNNPTPANELAGNQQSKAPVDQETTKIENTPTGTVTTKTTPKEAPMAGFNQGTGREMEINQHLNEGYTNDPKVKQAIDSGNYDAFKQAYGYDTADTTKKGLLDSFFKSHQPSSSQDIFNTLMSGGKITDRNLVNSPMYAEAARNAGLVKQFALSNGKEISDAVDAGTLVEGTPAFDALAQTNPVGIAAYTKYKADKIIADQVNNSSSSYYSSLNSVSDYDKNKTVGSQSRKPSPVQDLLQKLSDRLTENSTPDYAKKWAEMITNNPEVQTYKKQVADYQEQLKTLQQDQIDMEDNIKAELKGTGAPQSYIDAVIRERLKPLYKTQNSLNIKLQTAQGMLTSITQDAKDQLDLEQKTNAERNAQFGQAMQLANMAIGQENFQQTQDFQREQAQAGRDFQEKMFKTQQAYANPDINSSDPNIQRIALNKAVGSVYDQFKSLGFSRTPEQISSDIQAGIASGQYANAQEGLQDLMKNVQAKPGYQALLQNAQGITGKVQVIGEQIDPNTGTKISIYGKVDKNGNIVPIDYTSAGSADFSSIAYKYPGEASLKNNNPAGIKTSISERTKKLLEDAGISWSEGSKPPSGEGGTYMKFATVQDGINAHKVLLTSAGTDDVEARLKQWVGTSEGQNYANQLMGAAGIPKGAKFSELSSEQLDKLVQAQMQKESPGFYKELIKIQSEPTTTSQTAGEGENPDKFATYKDFIEKGNLPSNIKYGTDRYNAFVKEANTGYVTAKQNEVAQNGFQLDNPKAYMSKDMKTREEIDKSITQVQPFLASMDRLIEMVKANGTELPYTEVGKMMAAESRNSQLIAKEIYNLGVLNGPDLSLMESVIPNPTTAEANTIGSVQDYVKLLEAGKQKILENMNEKAKSIGMSYAGSPASSSKQSSSGAFTTSTGKQVDLSGLADILNQ